MPKAIEFETYGPFPLNREGAYVSRDALEDFWYEVEQARKGLPEAIGIYIVAIKSKTTPKPWYVGKTNKGFRRRFAGHAAQINLFGRLHEASPRGVIEVYVIARITPGRKALRAPSLARKGLKSTTRLETSLIATCYAKNSKLLNLQQKTFFERLQVPVYVGKRVGQPNSAAVALRKLLLTDEA